MASKRGITGRIVQGGEPEWGPLLKIAPEIIGDFMWMFEVELADGRRLDAYKHFFTRGYVHLDPEGNAFAYVDTGRPSDLYRPVDLVLQLEAVLEPWWEELSATVEQTAACWTVIDRLEREGITPSTDDRPRGEGHR